VFLELKKKLNLIDLLLASLAMEIEPIIMKFLKNVIHVEV